MTYCAYLQLSVRADLHIPVFPRIQAQVQYNFSRQRILLGYACSLRTGCDTISVYLYCDLELGPLTQCLISHLTNTF